MVVDQSGTLMRILSDQAFAVRKRGAVAALFALALQGCAMGPDYVRPRLDIPEHVIPAEDARRIADVDWWRSHAQARFREMEAVVSVYAALGGGWVDYLSDKAQAAHEKRRAAEQPAAAEPAPAVERP